MERLTTGALLLCAMLLTACDAAPAPAEGAKLPAPTPAACAAPNPGDTYTLTACPNGGALCTYHFADGTHLPSWGCSVEGVTCVEACE